MRTCPRVPSCLPGFTRHTQRAAPDPIRCTLSPHLRLPVAVTATVRDRNERKTGGWQRTRRIVGRSGARCRGFKFDLSITLHHGPAFELLFPFRPRLFSLFFFGVLRLFLFSLSLARFFSFFLFLFFLFFFCSPPTPRDENSIKSTGTTISTRRS